jgi:hypothetical protein
MADFGRRLFESVFVGPVALCYARSLISAADQGRGLRIRLRLTDVPELLDLPWELLFDAARGGFVASSNRTPVIRYLDLALPLEPLAVEGPLRMLVVVSSPKDLPRLDVRVEWDRLSWALRQLSSAGRVAVDRLEVATLEELRRTLRTGHHHVLHYIGHGGFDHEAGQGVLVLEAHDESSARVRAEDLSDALGESETLRLIVLNTCEGARGSVVDPFAGTAQALVARGIPAVVAMQFEVTDAAAVGFASGFYTATAAGAAVDDAVTEARLAMLTQGDGSEWATPVLYTHAEDTAIFALPPAAAVPVERDVSALPGGGRVVAGAVQVRVDEQAGVWVDPNPRPVTTRPRPSPVAVLPPPFPMLLGRDAELAVATGEAAGAMVRFAAEPGWGKSALLRAWANRAVGVDPGGLLFLRALTRPAMDVLQFVFEELFETDVPFRPDEGQLAGWLAGIQAAVVLDDVRLTAEERVKIRRVAPRCRFVLAGRSQAVDDDSRLVALGGLPVDAGIELVSLELGRPLEGTERDDAGRLCGVVEGSPARILSEAERSWQEGRPLAEIVAELSAKGAAAPLAGVGEAGRRVLGILAAVDPVPVHVDHLIAVAKLDDPVPVLESLERARLIVAGSPMYSLAFPLTGAMRRELEADAWSVPTFEHLARWGALRATPEEVLRDSDLLLTAMSLGREAGRDHEVVTLGRAIEGPFIAGRRWGQWGMALETGLAAAVAGGDVAAEAWASHQLGSRALGLGDRATATEQLSKAVRLRESIHDEVGLRASRHNLGLASGGAPPPEEPSGGGGGGGGARWGLWLGALGVLAVIGVVAWLAFGRNEGTPPPPGTPVRTLAPSPIEFGSVTIEATATQGVAVSNQGGGAMTIGVPTLDPPVDAVTVGGSCEGATLGPGESCLVELTFTPGSEESFQTTLIIPDDTGASPQRVPVTGEGVPEPMPAVSLDPPGLDFGPGVVGASEPNRETLTVTNSGQADLSIQDVMREGSSAFRVLSDDCRQATVSPGDSCSVEVSFTPETRGPFEGKLILVDNAAEGRQVIVLTGVGVTDRPDLVVPGFRQIGEPRQGDGTVDVPVEVVVRNDGDVPAGIFKVSVDFASDVEGSFPVQFIADRTSDVDPGNLFYPFSTRELGPGEQIAFTGVLRFADRGRSRSGEAVAVADSCSGDEFQDPASCRVEEFDEGNNRSDPLPLKVPTFVVD